MTVNVSGDAKFPLSVSLVNTHLDSRKWRHKQAQVCDAACYMSHPHEAFPDPRPASAVRARRWGTRLTKLQPPPHAWIRTWLYFRATGTSTAARKSTRTCRMPWAGSATGGEWRTACNEWLGWARCGKWCVPRPVCARTVGSTPKPVLTQGPTCPLVELLPLPCDRPSQSRRCTSTSCWASQRPSRSQPVAGVPVQWLYNVA